jgi:ATP-binding cassette, subfamily A (ABC1), member 3
MLTGM